MAYDKRFKPRVLEHLCKGHTQQGTAKLFGTGTTTLKEWKKRQEAGGTLEAKARRRKPEKIEPERLREYILAHPDAYIREIAEGFGGVGSAVRKALKGLGITREKRR